MDKPRKTVRKRPRRTFTPEFKAEADVYPDGTIDAADSAIVLGGWQSALPTGVLSSPLVDNRIGYCGYVFAPETGMYLVRHRWYLPPLGRWGQRDPIGYVDGMSLYEYVQSRSVTNVDPMGLDGMDLKLDRYLRTRLREQGITDPKERSGARARCVGTIRVLTYTLAESDDRTGMPARTREAGRMRDLVEDVREQLRKANACCVERIQIDAHSGVAGNIRIAEDFWIDPLHLKLLSEEFNPKNTAHVKAREMESLLRELCSMICIDRRGGGLELVQCGVGKDGPAIDYLKDTCGDGVTVVTWSGSVRWFLGGTWSWPWGGKWKQR